MDGSSWALMSLEFGGSLLKSMRTNKGGDHRTDDPTAAAEHRESTPPEPQPPVRPLNACQV